MNKLASDAKVHYKSYKAGKHWVVASITAVTLGLGLMGATETAQADENVAPATTEATTGEQSASAKEVTLQTTPTTVVDEAAEKVDTPSVVEPEVPETPPTSVPTADDPQEPTMPEATNPEEINDPDVAPEGDTDPQPDAIEPDVEAPVTDPATDPANETPTPNEVVTPEIPAQQPMRMSARATVSPIDGVNASEWLPDATLRALIIKVINRGAPVSQITGKPTYVATESNLYQYVAKLNQLTDYGSSGVITSFAGLEYFPALHTISLTNIKNPVAALIDFSNVPLLASIDLTLTNDGADHDMATIMNTYFENCPNLRFLRMGDSQLTGSIPDLSKYAKLEMIYLGNNQLTGEIPDLSAIPNLWSLDVNHNQLSGAFPDVSGWPSLYMLDVSYNQFSGALPDLSQFRGQISYMFNRLSNGVIQMIGKDGQPVVNYGVYQRLIGNTHKISADNRTFDPVTGVITGFQDMSTGQIDDNEGTWTAALASGVTIAYGDLDPNLPTEDIAAWATTAEDATDWFSVQRISGNKVALMFTAKDDVPDGTYTVHIINQSYGALWGYSAYITFKIENEKPVDPGNPGTPDPGVTTGTVTIVNVDQDGKVISQTQQSGNVGDAFTINAQKLPGYQLVGNDVASGTYTAAGQTVTFTYQAVSTGGDGDLIDPDTPVVDDAGDAVTGGDADQIVPGKQAQKSTSKRAEAVKLNAKATTATTQRATQQQVATDAAATLPQTDEATMSPWAGLALLLGSALTGFALNRKRRR